jgi:predicted nuclease of restriction endonuclease-like (RecB) superfamily
MNQTQKSQSAVFKQIRDIILQARHASYTQINTLKVVTNYMIGKTIVENTQSGSERAGYGKETLKAVSEKLSKEFGRGFSVDNLELMRSFYINYREKLPFSWEVKSETLSRIFKTNLKSETLSRISGTYERSETISSTFSDKANLLKLSWSHFVLLLKMDKIERGFYELEAITNNWSIREFERQYNSSLYERLALSKNKEAVKQLSQKGQLTHQDIGQLQMYVNYFDRMVKTVKENPSIGIILCKQSNRAVVEFTLPEKEKQIFAREYKLYLPAKEDLKKQIENL